MTKSKTKEIFLALFISIFVAMLGIGVIAPIMPIYASTLGASGISLGLVFAVFALSRTLFMPMVGRLSDRYDRKLFILTGLIIYTLTSVGYVWSQSVVQLLWIRLLHGIGSAMVIPIAAAIIGDISPKGQEGRMMGGFQVAMFLGFGFGPLMGGVLSDVMGLSQVFYIMGGFSLIALLLVLILLPASGSSPQKRGGSGSSFKVLLRLDMYKGLMIFRFVNAMARGVLITFLPVIAYSLNIRPSEIGILLSFNLLITAVLQYVFGKIADKICRPHLVVIGSVLTGLSLVMILFAHTLTEFFVVSLLMGLGGGIAFPAAGALATELGRDHGMGNIMGWFNTGQSLGQVVGPVFAGGIMDLFGLPFVFICMGVAGLLGSALTAVWMYRENSCVHVKNF